MDSFSYDLAANLAVVAVFLAAWALALDWLSRHGRWFRVVALGLFMGLGAMASMVFAIRMQPGIILDLRLAPLAVAGLFGGPAAALIAGGIAAAYRALLGGVGMWAGLIVIALVTMLGLLVHFVLNGRAPRTVHVLVLAAGTAAVALLATFALLPAGPDVTNHAIPLAVLAFLTTLAAGLVIRRSQRAADERDLVRVALMQAPDFHYVKDRAGVIAVANEAVARYNGYASPREIVGKTDFELTDQERAQMLFNAEQHLMRTGVPLLEQQEHVVGPDGVGRWFLTSKVPLRNVDGETIGLTGVTRDVTENHRMEAALTDSRNLLSYAVEGMADGLAMFDRTGHLVYCNERYRSLFPLTADIRQPGAHIRDILRRVVETGEQVNLGDPVTWLARVADSLSKHSEQQVSLCDGRWLHIRTRPTEHGAAMVVVSDVTSFKRTEGELRSLTSELKLLAETDGLTGLMNRRSFDARIEEELARSERERRPLSVVLFDVDHFKSYNDTLGHPAGDECLKVVARCVKMALLRQGDVAARYGGEEFIAILPGTDEDSAYQVAERARRALLELGVPHGAVRGGRVTMSAGIATYAGPATPLSSSQLVLHADEALYQAKGAGRNRVMGWKPRDTVRAAG